MQINLNISRATDHPQTYLAAGSTFLVRELALIFTQRKKISHELSISSKFLYGLKPRAVELGKEKKIFFVSHHISQFQE